MQWSQTDPTNTVLDYPSISYHLRLDPDTAAVSDEETYVMDLVASATSYAEQAMSCSLLTRTITATYYAGDRLSLPRGPVQAIVSVVDALGATLPTTAYSLSRVGLQDLLTCDGNCPLTVVYTAGYGDTADTVPADIRQAIRMQVSSWHDNREGADTVELVPVEKSLTWFYAARNRAGMVG